MEMRDEELFVFITTEQRLTIVPIEHIEMSDDGKKFRITTDLRRVHFSELPTNMLKKIREENLLREEIYFGLTSGLGA